jgi:hypothetical protein
MNALKLLIEKNEAELTDKANRLAKTQQDIDCLQNDLHKQKSDYEKMNENFMSEKQLLETKLNECNLRLTNYEEIEVKKLQKALDLANVDNNRLTTDKIVVENELQTVKELYSKLVDEKDTISKELNRLKHDDSDKNKIELVRFSYKMVFNR